jgi:hypothetical protein
LWLDISNTGYLIEDNLCEYNNTPAGYSSSSAGIFIEISFGGTIRNNTCQHNGYAFNGYLWNAGILIAASGGTGIEIYGNTILDNEHGIALIQQDRSGDGANLFVKNVNVHNNTIWMDRGMTGAAQDSGTNDIFAADQNNHFDFNTYHLSGTGHFAWQGEKTQAQWVAAGQDVNGTFL